MRVRSDIFVAALVRRMFSRGDFAAVEHKGMDEAGAIFVRQRCRDGLENLFGPAPQSLIDAAGSGPGAAPGTWDGTRKDTREDRGQDHGWTDSRRFEPRLTRVSSETVSALMERERRFDPDLWLVEVETDALDDCLPLIPAPAPTSR